RHRPVPVDGDLGHDHDRAAGRLTMDRNSPAAVAYRAISGRMLGIAFLVMVLLFVWLTYAIYNKKFVDYVPVHVRASSIGLQLNDRADVKLRGMIVGEVRSTE